jgi:hypothetical protein
MRDDSRPASPMVLRKRVTTRDFAAIEVLVAADFCDRGGHLRGDAGRHGCEHRGGGAVAEQPIAESADGETRDRREGAGIMGVDDEARHLVVLIRDDRLVKEMRERQVGKRYLRCHSFRGGRGGDAGEAIARARRRRFGQQGFQIGEGVPRPVDRDRMHRCRAFQETARTNAAPAPSGVRYQSKQIGR